MDHSSLARDRQMQLPCSDIQQQQVAGSRIRNPPQTRRLRDRAYLRDTAATQRIATRHRDPISEPRQPHTIQPERDTAPMQPESRPDRAPRPIERTHPPG